MYEINSLSTSPCRTGYLRSGCNASCCLAERLSCYRPRTKYEGSYCFHRCLAVNISGGGTPFQVWVGFTLSQVRGYPVPGMGEGVLHPRSGWRGTPSQVWVGVTPSQVWMGGGYPIPGLGGRKVPHSRSGWWGVPRVLPCQV